MSSEPGRDGAPPAAADSERLELFSSAAPRDGDGLTRPDPRVVGLSLAAVGLVMAMVSVLSIVNNGLTSVVTLVLLLITALALWLGWRMRSPRPTVVLDGSWVRVNRRGQTYAFDLSSESVQVVVSGRVSDAAWTATFVRRGLPDVVIDASQVDPYTFMAALRSTATTD